MRPCDDVRRASARVLQFVPPAPALARFPLAACRTPALALVRSIAAGAPTMAPHAARVLALWSAPFQQSTHPEVLRTRSRQTNLCETQIELLSTWITKVNNNLSASSSKRLAEGGAGTVQPMPR
eukprot:scaffold80210_cov34-Tisochrysis_lutea.AAC.2